MRDVISFPDGATDDQKEKLTAMQEELRKGTEAAVQLLIKAEIPFVLLQPILGTTGIAIISNLNFDYQQLTLLRAMLNLGTMPDSVRKTEVKMAETDVKQ